MSERVPFAALLAHVESFARPARESYAASSHVLESELQCHCGCGKLFIVPQALELFERIREQCGISIRINSAWRCQSWNRRKGGGAKSRHLLGCALDLDVPEKMTWAGFYAVCERVTREIGGGVGAYSSFVHVDCWAWPRDRRWDDR